MSTIPCSSNHHHFTKNYHSYNNFHCSSLLLIAPTLSMSSTNTCHVSHIKQSVYQSTTDGKESCTSNLSAKSLACKTVSTTLFSLSNLPQLLLCRLSLVVWWNPNRQWQLWPGSVALLKFIIIKNIKSVMVIFKLPFQQLVCEIAQHFKVSQPYFVLLFLIYLLFTGSCLDSFMLCLFWPSSFACRLLSFKSYL